VIHPIPTWLKNTLLLILLFALFGLIYQSAEAPRQSQQNLDDALFRLDVPPRDGSPFTVPADGPVLVDGRKVRCPFTGSHFVWMGLTGNGTRLVISKAGGGNYVFFVRSAETDSLGIRFFAANGIREHDPGLKIWQKSDRSIDRQTHELIVSDVSK